MELSINYINKINIILLVKDNKALIYYVGTKKCVVPNYAFYENGYFWKLFEKIEKIYIVISHTDNNSLGLLLNFEKLFEALEKDYIHIQDRNEQKKLNELKFFLFKF